MPSEEVQSVLFSVRQQIEFLQEKANRGPIPTTNLHAQRLAKGLEEIEELLAGKAPRTHEVETRHSGAYSKRSAPEWARTEPERRSE